MSPQDARHGTYAGAVAHWLEGGRPCPACFTAETRYRKARKLKHLRGEPVTFPALSASCDASKPSKHSAGPARRSRTRPAFSVNTLRSIGYHGSGFVHWPTASKVIAVYDLVCMTRPEGHYANRGRNAARRRNYAPPLAYDDIDADAEPTGMPLDEHDQRGVQRRPNRRASSALEHAVEHGHTLARVCTDLNLSINGVQHWCARNGRRDIYEALSARQRTSENATTKAREARVQHDDHRPVWGPFTRPGSDGLPPECQWWCRRVAHPARRH